MTAKTGTKAGKAKSNPNALSLEGTEYADEAKRDALIAASLLVRGAVTGCKYAEGIFGADVDLTSYLSELRKQADAVKAGDLCGVERMLVTQANTLDMIFNQLARRSAFCEYLNQFEANLRLALKAQAQCRATLEALAEIRNPRPVAFVKQANIANGPQQVNNQTGDAPPAPYARAENSANPSNELLTDDHGTTLDSGTESDAGRSHPALEAAGKLDGAAH